MAATDFRDREVKDGRQAEFLVHRYVPWHLVERIGVMSTEVQTRALHTLSGAAHRPADEVRPDWHF